MQAPFLERRPLMSFHSQISAAATPAADAPTCTLAYIKRQLGRGDFGDRRMCTYVRALIAGEGFPPPLPCLIKRELTREVTPKSRWIRASVDAWIEDFLPPANAAAVDRAAMAAAAEEMDRAAGNLGSLTLISGGRA
jgi:hypothetical protein